MQFGLSTDSTFSTPERRHTHPKNGIQYQYSKSRISLLPTKIHKLSISFYRKHLILIPRWQFSCVRRVGAVTGLA